MMSATSSTSAAASPTTGASTSALRLIAVCVLILGATTSSSGNNQQMHRRFEYKYSFKPPYLAQKDGTVPFWEYGGNAIASSENVRVAPSLRSQKGAIWTKIPTNFDWWEIEVVFRVSGRGRIGADGLAIWYTTAKGDYQGDVFGSSDSWNGLGVFFDSFDNDNKHNNPYIMGVLNDGTKQFDHANDGASQLLSGCLRDFRNKPFPTRARIEYYQNVLTVLFHNGMTNNNDDYEMCLRAENVFLPKSGHFGVSAATGGLADDHDVFHFLTTSLHVPGQVSDHNRMPEADSAKLAQEYQDYQKKLDIQKEEYHKEHPELEKKTPEDFDEWYETDNQRELRQVWSAQTQMTDVLRDLSRKVDEVIGRQERTLGLLSTNAGGAGGAIAGAPVVAGTGDLKRHEIDALLTNQNAMLATLRDLRTVAGEVTARTDSILQNQARAPTAQIQHAGGYGFDVQATVNELRESLNQVKQGVLAANQRLASGPAVAAGQQAAGGCPAGNCLGTTAFLVVTAVQLALMLAYTIYRDNRDSQAKKFY